MQTKDRKAKSILVVDDETEICEFLATLLRAKTPYTVTTCSDPVKALEMARQSHFDLVISDIRMPRMDGVTLLGHLKEIDADLEVIMLTGHSAVDTAVGALQHRAYEYLEKPVQAARLLQTVGNALARQELSSQLSEMVNKVASLNRTLRTHAREMHQVLAPMERSATARLIVKAVHEKVHARLEKLRSAAQEALRSQGVEPLRLALEEALNQADKIESSFDRARARLRVTAGAPKIQDVVGFVRQTVTDTLAVYPQIKSETKFPPEEVTLPFEPLALGQALIDLLDHAVKRTGEKGVIGVEAGVDSGEFGIVIRDDGPPVDAAAAEAAFDPLDDAGHLGLAIARRLLKNMGGTIAFGSPTGRGAQLQVRFPLIRR